MQLPVAAAPGVLLIVRKKCNLLLGNVKTYSFTSVLITGEFVVILLLFNEDFLPCGATQS